MREKTPRGKITSAKKERTSCTIFVDGRVYVRYVTLNDFGS